MHAREQLKAPKSIDNPQVWVCVGFIAAVAAWIIEGQLSLKPHPHPLIAAAVAVFGLTIGAVFGGVFFRLACHWSLNLDVQWPAAWQRCVVSQGVFAIVTLPNRMARAQSIDYTTLAGKWSVAYDLIALFIVSWLITVLTCRYQHNERFGFNRAAKVTFMETIIVVCAGLLVAVVFVIAC